MHEKYLASQKDKAMMVCCLEDQVIGPSPQRITYPEMDFQPSDIAQCESVKEQKTGNIYSWSSHR